MTQRINLHPLLLSIPALVLLAAPVCHAQDSRFHHPLNQRTPLGKTAAWLSHIHGHQEFWLQPVQVSIPGGGDVSIYSAAAEPMASTKSPALVAVNAGHTYRLKLANMPEFPDAELYPSIEILDRLHPPAGQENRYPIPVPFTRRDIARALSGKLVTRVIYVEDPETAQMLDPLHREIPQAVTPAENALQQADLLGRPMIIVRLGNRRPSEHQTASLYYGTGGAVELRDQSPTREVTRVDRPQKNF